MLTLFKSIQIYRVHLGCWRLAMGHAGPNLNTLTYRRLKLSEKKPTDSIQIQEVNLGFLQKTLNC